MNSFTRRRFLQTALLAGAVSTGNAFKNRHRFPLLSFSTLGCPDWSFEKIAAFAKAQGYHGLEIRGIQRELDLPKCKIFNNPEIKNTIATMKQAGLKFVNLGSSAALHHPNGPERTKSMEEARRFIDLAQQIVCPYIRVFPNNFPKDQEKKQTIDLIAAGLSELSGYAKGSNVTVLMETHGDLVYTSDLISIMESASNKHTGLIWDACNMWTVTKEPVGEVYARLKKYIRHTHIKDARLVDGKPVYTLLGKGEVPIVEAVALLQKNNYKGFYSFEWEKLWHPEIAEPEIAIADYSAVMKKLFE